MKSFARAHDMTIIIVAHPRKLGRDRNGKIPKPTLWDIADSAAWANRCDAGVVIYRPDMHDAVGSQKFQLKEVPRPLRNRYTGLYKFAVSA